MYTPPTPRPRAAVALGFLIVFSSLLLFISFAYGHTDGTLQVDYIDVGQGDSIYLHDTDGIDILIDGGPRAAGPTVVAPAIRIYDSHTIQLQGWTLRDEANHVFTFSNHLMQPGQGL
jgi:hypothetical protein